MILSLCLNPAMDKSIYLDQFSIGQTNRSKGETQKPGGKGINCAVILAGMGIKTTAACLMSEQDRAELAPLLRGLGCELKTVYTEEKLRVNLKIIDQSRGEVTEINAPGVPVGESQLAQMSELVKRLSPSCGWVLLTGSLPPGCPDSYYAGLMRLIRQRAPSTKIALDAGGEAFRLALREKPDLIKPNLEELSGFLGYAVRNRPEALKGAEILAAKGAGDMIISMGSRGALLYTKEERAFAPALSLPVVSTVGAGDAMLSGYVAGLEKGWDPLLSFRLALGAAAAAVTGKSPQVALADDWLERFQIQTIE